MIFVMKDETPSIEIERIINELQNWDVVSEELVGRNKIGPPHATGKSKYVQTMTMSAIAANTDSLMVEVYPIQPKHFPVVPNL